MIDEIKASGFELVQLISDWPGRGPLESYCAVFRNPSNNIAASMFSMEPGMLMRETKEMHNFASTDALPRRSPRVLPAEEVFWRHAFLTLHREDVMLKRVDHIYVAVSDFARSERFYDAVMRALGQHKGDKIIAGEPHAHYLGPEFQLTIRPARTSQKHDPYAPGMHHLCFTRRRSSTLTPPTRR